MAQQERFELYLIRGIARGKRVLCSRLCSCGRTLKILLHFLLGGFEGALADVGIDIHRRGELGVAEKGLHRLKVDAALIEGGRVAVANLMRGNRDAGRLLILFVRIEKMVVRQGLTVGLGEEVAFWQADFALCRCARRIAI